jgi:hypothetical protein
LVAGGRGLGRLIKSSIEAAENVGLVAGKLGITTDALQEFRFAADQVGVATTTLDMGLQRFARRAQEAQAGTGEAKDAIKELKIELFETGGAARKTEELFADAMEALAGVEVEKRLRLAFKLFDSEGVALVNLANNFDEMRQAARAAGVVLDRDTIQKAGEARRTISALSLAMDTELREAMVALAPTLINSLRFFRQISASLGDMFHRIQDIEGLSLKQLEKQAAELLFKIVRAKDSLAQAASSVSTVNITERGVKMLEEEVRLYSEELDVLAPLIDAKREIRGARTHRGAKKESRGSR